jgi:hypothetical protein
MVIALPSRKRRKLVLRILVTPVLLWRLDSRPHILVSLGVHLSPSLSSSDDVEFLVVRYASSENINIQTGKRYGKRGMSKEMRVNYQAAHSASTTPMLLFYLSFVALCCQVIWLGRVTREVIVNTGTSNL